MTTLTVTVREAAAVTGIGRDRLYELVRSGRVPAIRAGRRLLIPRQALADWVAAEAAAQADARARAPRTTETARQQGRAV